MKKVTLYFWRVQNFQGKWCTTRYRATEDDIRKEHPEAVRVDSDSLTFDKAETEEEATAMDRKRCLAYPAAPGHRVD